MNVLEFLRALDKEDLETPDNPVLIQSIADKCSATAQHRVKLLGIPIARWQVLKYAAAGASLVSEENTAEYTKLLQRCWERTPTPQNNKPRTLEEAFDSD